MKSRFSYLTVTVVTALAAFAVSAQGGTPLTPMAVPKAPADPVIMQVQAMQAATDPSEVVAAYAVGVGVDAKSVLLNEAYLRKMVSLRLPHLASSQAELLTQLDAANGLAWAVLAFSNAQKGMMEPAFAHSLLAVGRSPRDPFVIATAAQLVAWYDSKPDRPENTPAVSALAARLRGSYADNPAYAQRYQEALAAIRQQEAVAIAPPAAASPTPLAPENQTPTYVEPTTNNYYYSNGYDATPTYDTTPTYGGGGGYFYPPYFYYPSFYGWGGAFPSTFVDSSFAFPSRGRFNSFVSDGSFNSVNATPSAQMFVGNGNFNRTTGTFTRSLSGQAVGENRRWASPANGGIRVQNFGASNGFRSFGTGRHENAINMSPTPMRSFRSSSVSSSGFSGHSNAGFRSNAVSSNGGGFRGGGFTGGARSSGFSGGAARGGGFSGGGGAARGGGFSGGGGHGGGGGGGHGGGGGRR